VSVVADVLCKYSREYTARYTATTSNKLLLLDFPNYLHSVDIQSANGVLGSEGG
jgi:hypothetical protein